MPNKFKIIIIDDEKLARELIKSYLTDNQQVGKVIECTNGFEGLKAINEEKPDIVFLDIQMPKINGFEMLELLDSPANIIFTTAFDQYALKAFEVNAVDYLLKPFSKERFTEALNKASAKINLSPKTDEYAGLIKNYNDNEEKLNRVIVKKNHNIIIIPTNKIIFIEAQDDYTSIVTDDGKYLKQKTMKYFENHLPENFIRIHRSYILNIDYTKQIELMGKETHVVILKNGNRLAVSKSGYTRLKELLK